MSFHENVKKLKKILDYFACISDDLIYNNRAEAIPQRLIDNPTRDGPGENARRHVVLWREKSISPRLLCRGARTNPRAGSRMFTHTVHIHTHKQTDILRRPLTRSRSAPHPPPRAIGEEGGQMSANGPDLLLQKLMWCFGLSPGVPGSISPGKRLSVNA